MTKYSPRLNNTAKTIANCVVYTVTSNHIYELSLQADSWHVADLTEIIFLG